MQKFQSQEVSSLCKRSDATNATLIDTLALQQYICRQKQHKRKVRIHIKIHLTYLSEQSVPKGECKEQCREKQCPCIHQRYEVSKRASC